MTYEKSIPLSGDPRRALDFAAVTLAGAGLKLESSSADGLEAASPGYFNSKQNPLSGFSRLRLRATAGSIQISGELGAADGLLNMLSLILLVVTIAEGVGFVVAYFYTHKIVFPLVAAGTVVLWVILIPVLRKTIRRQIVRAGDRFVANLAAMAQ